MRVQRQYSGVEKEPAAGKTSKKRAIKELFRT